MTITLSPNSTLSLITVLFWFAQYIHVPFQTPYLSSQSVSAGTIGIIIGLYGLAQLLGRVPLGIMADLRGKHKPFIVFGLICTIAASLLRYSLPTGNGYLMANLLSGAASASWVCFVVMYTSFFPPEDLSAATGRIISYNNFGILLGFLTGMLMRDTLGMRSLCLTGAVSAFIGLILSYFLTSGTNVSHIAPHRAELWQVFRNPQVILFGLAALVQQGVVASTSNSFTSQVAKDLGANALQLGLCSIIYILSAVISSRFSGMKKISRIKPSESIPLLFALLGLYCLLVPNLTSVFQLFFVQILAGLSQGWLFAATNAEALRGIDDSVHSTAMGYFAAIYAIGMTLFPMLTGKLAGLKGMLMAYYVIAAICFMSAVLMALWYHFINKQRSGFRAE